MITVMLRTVILYFTVTVALRIMGKRTLGELQPNELVVTMLIAELAGIPIQEPEIPLVYGVVPITTLLFLEVLFSYLALKNDWIRKAFIGRPSIIIHQGIIDQKEMERQRLNMDDLLAGLRQQEICDLSTVAYAILETDGKLSVMLQAKNFPLTLCDIGRHPQTPLLQHILISGGKLRSSTLRMIKKDTNWLHNQLQTRQISKVQNVLLMTADEEGNTTIIQKESAQ